jgi:hypothetical protein
MSTKNAIIAAGITCLFLMLPVHDATARVSVSQENQTPWTFGAKWSFTWVVQESANAWERGTRLRFTSNQPTPLVSGVDLVGWRLTGNLSRQLDLGSGGTWMDMKHDVIYAEFDTVLVEYMFTTDALVDNVLLLPLAKAIPMLHFKHAFTPRCNDTTWSITLDEGNNIFDAVNKTSALQRVFLSFNEKGVVKNMTTTTANGSISFQMLLESMYDPEADISRFFNVMTLLAIGAIITVVISCLFKKYKIKVKDVVKDKRALPDEIASDDDADETDDEPLDRAVE